MRVLYFSRKKLYLFEQYNTIPILPKFYENEINHRDLVYSTEQKTKINNGNSMKRTSHNF